MTIDIYSDTIDVRDLIARAEELEGMIYEMSEADREADKTIPSDTVSDEYHDAHCELLDLTAALAELRGNGGDEQWRGDWYPVTLIRDSYFTDYARELADGCGMVSRDASWPHNCIDWEKAASQLQWDYTSIEIRGVTYWYR